MRERLRAAGKEDLAAWEQVRALLREAVSESTFEIWLAPLELIAVDLEGALIIAAPAETAGWVTVRFGRLLDGAAQRAGHRVRLADEVERRAADLLASAAARASVGARSGGHVGSDRCAIDRSHTLSAGSLPDGRRGSRVDQSSGKPPYTSAYPSSYTDVYTQTKEAS
jgi:DnaA N-terminal domain